jgi:hypothetical protein
MVLPGQKNVEYKITNSDSSRTYRVTDVQVDQPLPDELFK